MRSYYMNVIRCINILNTVPKSLAAVVTRKAAIGIRLGRAAQLAPPPTRQRWETLFLFPKSYLGRFCQTIKILCLKTTFNNDNLFFREWTVYLYIYCKEYGQNWVLGSFPVQNDRKAYLTESPSLETAIPFSVIYLKHPKTNTIVMLQIPLVQFYLSFILVIVCRYRLFWSKISFNEI